MRFAKTALAALVGVASAQNSIFVAPEQQLAFGISIPDNTSSKDVYFSLIAPSDLKWASVGLGSSRMAGALFLIIYSSSSGANVTMSARTTSGNVEPTYDSSIEVEALSSTGIVNGTMAFLGRCANCRSWSGGGFIDVTSSAQDCIFGLAPGRPINSDNPAAPLNYHTVYGSFSIDLAGAVSSIAAAPSIQILTNALSSSGATLLSSNNTQDWTTIFHAVVMIACFIGLLPLGIVFLRVNERVRWHAVNQTLALIGIIIGAGLGIYDSMRYNRSKSFGTAHQIIGLLVSILTAVQFCLGFFHHRIYKQTRQTTKLAPMHVWLGRIVIIAAVVVAFLGFPLALSNNGDIIFAVVVVVVAGVTGSLLILKKCSSRKQSPLPRGMDATRGSDQEPWQTVSSTYDSDSLPLRPYTTRETFNKGVNAMRTG